MDMENIKFHWQERARCDGVGLHATTRAESIKRLEIDVLKRWIAKKNPNGAKILEVGCGNGINCMALARLFPLNFFCGLDYIDEMIENSRKKCDGELNLKFSVDDVTKFDSDLVKNQMFDIIFSDRCLINLNTIDLQKLALKKIFSHLKVGGYYLMIENSVQSYRNQNLCRESVGLKKRVQAEFNFFIDDEIIIEYIQKELNGNLECIDNFASLHDIFLYVIGPMYNKGNIRYDDETVQKVTEFLLHLGDAGINKFGEFGQNRLYILRKGDSSC